MNSAAFRRFQGKAADLRQEIFGRDEEGEEQAVTYAGAVEPIAGYYTPVRYQRQLDELNMKEVHDVVWRISKAKLAVVSLGKQLAWLQDGAQRIARIDEIGSHPINPEWVLGCKALV